MNKIFEKILKVYVPALILAFFHAPQAFAEDFELGAREMPMEAGASLVKAPPRARVVQVSKPGELSQPDTEYILVNDIVADGTAFTVKGHNITINLNGHKIVYDSRVGNKEAFGVYIDSYRPGTKDIAIVNGSIIQGGGSCSGNQTGYGCNPVFAYYASGMEMGGITVTYRSQQTTGLSLGWVEKSVFHHNTFEDLGDEVTNRHQGVSVLQTRGGQIKFHNNLIKRARHRGVFVGALSEISMNQIHIDSVATNSTGIAVRSGSVHHNKIFGQGVHPIGIWPGDDIKVFSNYVEVESTRHGGEYGDTGAACLRMTWGNNRVEVMANTFILHAGVKENGVVSWGRALWVGLPDKNQEAYFHDNLIIANNRDGKSKAAGIAVVCLNESPKLVFSRNKVISNWANVLLADTYGHAGGYARFIENEFIRQDNHSSYKTIRSQYSPNQSTGVFINNKFLNGASIDNIDLEYPGPGKKDIAVGWYLDITVMEDGNPAEGADIEVRDSSGAVVYKGTAGRSGVVRAEVTEYLLTNQIKPWGKSEKTPHKVTVSKGAKSVTQTLSVNGNKSIRIKL